MAKPTTSSIKVWYIPNPFKWIHIRMEIATLQREWDSSFALHTFKYGAIQVQITEYYSWNLHYLIDKHQLATIDSHKHGPAELKVQAGMFW